MIIIYIYNNWQSVPTPPPPPPRVPLALYYLPPLI